MDIAKELVLNLKQSKISHAGYGLQKECEALIDHILQNMVKSQLPELIPEVKNEEDSIHYREEGIKKSIGNQQFVMGDDNEAIKYYTMSLAYATDNELMSYAYANRSAALYRKQMFKECLIDIDAALSHGYPEEKRKKLKERGAKAIEEIKKRLQLAKDHIDTETLADMSHGPSKETPAVSNGIKISFSEKYGRHLVATKEFKAGDVVTIENPYAYIIYTQRKLAWEMAHQIECPIMALVGNLLNVDKDKIRMLTKIIRFLIVVTSKGKNFNELRMDMEVAESNPDNRTAGFTDEGILDSTSARSALSLATNMTTRPLIGISAFACISALAALLLATQTNFFCNKYEVQQEPGIKTGSGLYVAHSLYNHSCAPNTFRHFEGLTMITRALRPIYPGDQIFTSYGAAYAYMTKSERREKIMQDYFFECDCIACAFNWPSYEEILQKHIGTISKNKELVERLKPYKQRLMKNMYDIDAVKSVLDILYKEVSQPCEEIIHAEQYLKSYYLGKFK
ncbi:N-lysine methyltransferase SMYD2-A [Melipona quadrifasciata]|uniref:N-lysine methyltransferase SMYD2-A n=1 Tax=Melipona quadrifasciata TaxID=166423 RepID=A0A0M9A8Z5_9HYME|nr:N-lysine methyltransferase SMYD2-A [Melipona quadrifasciata]